MAHLLTLFTQITANNKWPLVQLCPAPDNLVSAEFGNTVAVYAYYDVVVVVHNTVGGDINGEDRRKLADTLFDPIAAVRVTLPCNMIYPAKIGTAYTARHHVVPGCFIKG